MTKYREDYILIKSVATDNDGHGILAQLGEHLPYKQGVTGSSPVGPIIIPTIKYGEIAQLARAHGSYPWCRGFESPSRYETLYNFCRGFLFVCTNVKIQERQARFDEAGVSPTEMKDYYRS